MPLSWLTLSITQTSVFLMMHKTTALVMAAGFSRRFGSDKRLALLKSGQRIISETVNNIASAKLDYRIVIKPSDVDVFSTLFPAEQLIIVNNSEQGMGHSIAEGLSAIKNDCSSCLICLADMPFILPATYQKIAASMSAYDAVLPFYQGVKGNPVAINQSLYPQFLQLDGDVGGQYILRSDSINLLKLEMDDPGVLQDIDTPSDL